MADLAEVVVVDANGSVGAWRLRYGGEGGCFLGMGAAVRGLLLDALHSCVVETMVGLVATVRMPLEASQ